MAYKLNTEDFAFPAPRAAVVQQMRVNIKREHAFANKPMDGVPVEMVMPAAIYEYSRDLAGTIGVSHKELLNPMLHAVFERMQEQMAGVMEMVLAASEAQEQVDEARKKLHAASKQGLGDLDGLLGVKRAPLDEDTSVTIEVAA